MKQYLVLLFGLLCVLAVSQFPAEARLAPSSERYQQATASQSAELAEAQRLSDSAVRLYDMSKYDEALPLVKRALEIRERALGPVHVQVALTLAALGHVYMASDRFDEAGKVLQRSRDILEARPNPNDLQLVTVLEDLAFLNFRKHDYVNTESLIQRSLSIKEKTLGPVDVQVADSVVSLGRVFEVERKYDEADAQYVRAIRIREEKLGRSHRDTVETMKAYACLNVAMMPSTTKKPPQKVPNQDADPLRNRAHCWLAGFQDDCGTESTKFEGIVNGKAVKLAPPEYPAEARQQQRGPQLVYVAVLIDEKGNVIAARAVCGGLPSLVKTSEAAALASKFTPTLHDGKPIKVQGILNFRFVSR